MKILICGDSFAADWSKKYPECKGWATQLAEKYSVVNLAQAGVSQYKIYKQVSSVEITNFDVVIVIHTSPYRIVTSKHPLYSNDILHKDSDLIFSDIEYHAKKFINKFNSPLQTAYNFFIYHYDKEFQETTYNLYKEKVESLITIPKVIINNFEDWETIKINHKGNCNHLNDEGNKILFNRINDIIKKL